MDITPVFNEVLVRLDGRPIEPPVFRVEDLDEFLQEAYRIVGHVAHLTTVTTTNCDSEHMLQNSTRTSKQYDKAISQPHIPRAGNSIHA